LIGGIGAVTGYNVEIFAVLITILGGAFLIRAFDIDKAWATGQNLRQKDLLECLH